MGSQTLFEGRKHKITTDGETFFLYIKSGENKWELRDKNSLEKDMYTEALEDIKRILAMDMDEDEKILKICETGFFNVANL